MPVAQTRWRLLADVSGELTVVRLMGKEVALDEEAACWLRGQLLGLVEEGRHRLILDLGNVRFLTSTAVEAFLGVHRRLKAVGGRLALRNPTPPVAEVFAVLHLARVLDICSTFPGSVLSN